VQKQLSLHGSHVTKENPICHNTNQWENEEEVTQKDRETPDLGMELKNTVLTNLVSSSRRINKLLPEPPWNITCNS
jgi:hypothetical protein